MTSRGRRTDQSRYLLNREIELWVTEGRDRTGNRIDDLDPESSEAEKERARQEHCLNRMNAAAWELGEIKGRGSSRADARVVNIEDWRSR